MAAILVQRDGSFFETDDPDEYLPRQPGVFQEFFGPVGADLRRENDDRRSPWLTIHTTAGRGEIFEDPGYPGAQKEMRHG